MQYYDKETITAGKGLQNSWRGYYGVPEKVPWLNSWTPKAQGKMEED